MPFSMVLLGLAVLLAIPGDYGADRIFTCIEPFLTPRMAAEALVLAGLAAALCEVKPLAVALVITAALFHPIMAMAGVCALYCLYLGERKPIVATALAIVGLIALALAAFAMPRGPWGRFDPEWLTLVGDRSPYLFLAHWQLDDWSRTARIGRHPVGGYGRSAEPKSAHFIQDRARHGSLRHRSDPDRLRSAALGAVHSIAAMAVAMARHRRGSAAVAGNCAHSVGQEYFRAYPPVCCCSPPGYLQRTPTRWPQRWRR
jgi:hypothetical protein